MNTPLQTTFRNMNSSVAVIARIQKETDKLEKHFDRLIGCHVVVEAAHQPHRHGDPYRIHITLGVPGRELVVAHEPGWRAAAEGGEPHLHKHEKVSVPHQDIYVAIRDSFEAMRRQLQDYVHCLRREVKAHPTTEVSG